MKSHGNQCNRSFPQSSITLPDPLSQVTRVLSQVRELKEQSLFHLEEEREHVSDKIAYLGKTMPFYFGQDMELQFLAQRLQECADKMKRWDA